MTKKKHVTIKNPNNYLGYKLNNNYILNLNEMIFWTYILIFFLQNALRKNSRVLFATKFKFQQRIFNFLIKNSRLQLQLLKIFTQWVGGCLSNFLSIRWFYLFNRVKFYRQCPDILVLLEKKAADPLISEAYIMNIPVISYTSFTQEDPQLSYLLVGGNLGLDSKKNNFFFFVYLLKNMLVLESSLKKKKLVKSFGLKKKARRKPFFRVKKNRAYRLFGSRQFSIWRSHTRFNLKLKLLKIKFQLLEKILLRNFKMNKHFFKKRSTLAFIERLKSANYSIKCRKNIRFFFIIEGRLLVVLARMYIVRIVKQIELRILITQGYISVDNEIVKNPLYLTRHNSILRVLKRIPRIFSKLPKSLLLNNLKWLFYKRNRKKKRRRLTKLAGTKRIWRRVRTKKIIFAARIGKKKNYKTRLKKRQHKFFKKIGKRRFLRMEVRGRMRRSKGVKVMVPVVKSQLRVQIPYLFYKLKKSLTICNKNNMNKWASFYRLLGNKAYRYKFYSNKYSLIKQLRVNELRTSIFLLAKKRRLFLKKGVIKKSNRLFLSRKKKLIKNLGRTVALSQRKYKGYKYSLLVGALARNLGELSARSRKKVKLFRARKRFFVYRRKLRLRRRRVFRKGKKKKYTFIFLSFRKKKYKRRSSKSPSRKFFTNIWLIAFIFVKPVTIKKLWYSRLITNRVLSFFCTNFW